LLWAARICSTAILKEMSGKRAGGPVPHR
jgi:hypothetical protein